MDAFPNSALSFHRFLSDMASYGAGDGNAIFKIWPDFLGQWAQKEGHDTDLFIGDEEALSALVRAAKMPRILKDARLEIPGGEVFNWVDGHLDTIQTLFQMSTLGSAWQIVGTNLNGGVLTGLQALGSLFAQHRILLAPLPADLADINMMLHDLWGEVNTDDNIPEKTRAILLDKVHDLQTAVSQIGMFGSVFVRDSVFAAAAEVHLQQTESPLGHSNIFNRFLQIIGHVADVCGIVAFATLALGPGEAVHQPPQLNQHAAIIVNNIDQDSDIAEGVIVEEVEQP